MPLEAEHLYKPLHLIEKCMPFLHYCAANHSLNSTKKKSSIALASVCYVLQEQDELDYTHALGTAKSHPHMKRDDWLLFMKQKF